MQDEEIFHILIHCDGIMFIVQHTPQNVMFVENL